ncbi:two-component system response regulator YesN [Paenibacillus shirakamiensis]|uniref:Two-component system response regulator YesN n=2 Tax=Paenibacillus shirakamiensis TaxID=1265935 RepID=A0ABS4JCF1_9BACL|nr:two-component system response regulator YesN [Paenibacillus shirakamiensis]
MRNLTKVLPWEDMDFEIVGLAKNGIEALKMVNEHQPDLILSDIRMPVMDGITFIKELRSQNNHCEVLLLTGYQEFEYARAAIQYGVKDYICKPIDYVELENTVRTLSLEIKEKRKKLYKEQQLTQVVHWANENFLLHTLLGQETDKGDIHLGEDEDVLDRKEYAILLVDLEGYAHQSITWSVHERKAWNLHMKEMIRETFQPLMKEQTVLQIREGEWCVVCSSPGIGHRLSKELLHPGFLKLQALIDQKDNMLLRMCLEQGPIALSQMASVYKRMQQALIVNPANEWFVNSDKVVSKDAIPVQDYNATQWKWIEQIGTGLRNGDSQALQQMISELKHYVGHLNENSVGRAEKLLHYLLIHLIREMRELHMLPVDQEESVWQQLQNSLNLKDLLSLLVTLIERSRESVSSKKTSEQLMLSAQDYIQHKLGKDFGIEDIAEYLGISCSYFCLLFKNHFGETFVEYLTKQRMEMAKCLLRSSDKSIAQIGVGVGYQERRYFTKVFQKYIGMTPSEYRLKESPAS